MCGAWSIQGHDGKVGRGRNRWGEEDEKEEEERKEEVGRKVGGRVPQRK